MTAVRQWGVTLIDADGYELGTISIDWDEDRAFTEKRLRNLISVLDDLEEKTFREYRAVELLEDREKRMTGYDETLMQGIRAAFPQSNVDGLFMNHRPTEPMNGRAFFLRVIDAILKGFLTMFDNHVPHTWVQIEM